MHPGKVILYSEGSKAISVEKDRVLRVHAAEAATEKVDPVEHNELLLKTVPTRSRGTIFQCEKKPKPIHKVGV